MTVVDLFARHANSDAVVNFIHGASSEEQVGYAQLWSAAARRLAWLHRLGLASGDPLILCCRDNRVFLELFWACLLGGLVPVPVAVGVTPEHRAKLARIGEQLGGARVASDRAALDVLRRRGVDHAPGGALAATFGRLLETAITCDEPLTDGAPAELRPAAADDLAFIQYSSGSTREPRGVLVRHRNLLATVTDMVERSGHTRHDVPLSWMPLTHDMGLIGFHLCCIAAGSSHHIMDTDLFARRPALWLEKATQKRATVLCAPNFAYKHYLRAAAKAPAQPLDLGAVRLIINGAEPISVALCEEFVAALRECGLSPEAMCPAYGLAEAGLGVSMPEPGRGLRAVSVSRATLGVGMQVQCVAKDATDAVRFAIEGTPLASCRVRIGDGAGGELPAGRVGHIEIAGANVTDGYFGGAQESALEASNGWRDTGDLGFLQDGELVVTGRLKDVIVVGGLNHYAHDIEAVVVEADVAELGTFAVCAAPDDGRREDAVVLAFLRTRASAPEFAALASDVKRAVFERTGLELAHVIPVRQIPKTTSGKMRRHALAGAFAAGEYQQAIEAITQLRAAPRAAAATASATTQVVERLLQDVMNLPAEALQGDLFDIGITSQMLAKLSMRLNDEFPDCVDVTDFFDHTSVAAIAALIDARLAETAKDGA